MEQNEREEMDRKIEKRKKKKKEKKEKRKKGHTFTLAIILIKKIALRTNRAARWRSIFPSNLAFTLSCS